MSSEDRVLFTTIPRSQEGRWDNFKKDTQRRVFTYSFPRINSFGLRFLRYNIPNIDILEYPSWERYKSHLEKEYDVIGYSFYLNETNKILDMVKTAKEISENAEFWGGNYGALTPEVQDHFDEIFIGYAEEAVAEKLNLDIDRIRHPPLVWYVQTSFGLKVNPVGILFTTRGCPMSCEFCQTPSFCSKPKKLPLESIEEVIEKYQEMGIREVIIYDENFSLFPEHTEKVIEILHNKGIRWFCMTSVENLAENWREWTEMGMLGAFIGIESFSEAVLNSMSMKKTKSEVSKTIDLIEQVQDHLYLLGFFIIGYENDTVESVKENVDMLSSLKLDHTQIRILTPLPQTPLWNELESKYGIFEDDWSKYDTMHLVWDHPNFSPEELRKLLIRSLRKCHPRSYIFRTPLKLARRYTREKGPLNSAIYFFRKILLANTFDYSRY